MQVLVLGPEGPGRQELEGTLSRMGHVVMSQVPESRLSPAGDLVMLDLREDDLAPGPLVDALGADRRALVVVAERPSPAAKALWGARRSPTLALTGRESEAGYRIALTVGRTLARAGDPAGSAEVVPS